LLKIDGEQVSAVTKIVCRARKGYCGDMLIVQGWSILLSEDGLYQILGYQNLISWNV
jgi:hypothetical protein